MEIYLSEVSNQGMDFTFPSLPERISVKNGARYLSYDMIAKGTVKIPRGTEAGSISWSGVFYGKSKRREIMINEWTPPGECKKILSSWMEHGTVLRLMVTETGINYDVTISDFEYEEYGGYGNAEYSITFTVNRELKIHTTAELNIDGSAQPLLPQDQMEDRPTPAPANTYTVVKGDNLWKIARKFYGGSGANWEKIYNANAEVIEAAANRYRGGRGSSRGHWIYPGTVLAIP